MACRLAAPSHYLNQCWNIVNWPPRNKLQWKFNRNSDIFIHENATESVVCEMAAILSRLQCVNVVWPSDVVRRQISWPLLLRVMICRLIGTKPLPAKVDLPSTGNSGMWNIEIKIRKFSFTTMQWISLQQSGTHFLSASVWGHRIKAVLCCWAQQRVSRIKAS